MLLNVFGRYVGQSLSATAARATFLVFMFVLACVLVYVREPQLRNIYCGRGLEGCGFASMRCELSTYLTPNRAHAKSRFSLPDPGQILYFSTSSLVRYCDLLVQHKEERELAETGRNLSTSERVAFGALRM